jgi:hypothetical protein
MVVLKFGDFLLENKIDKIKTTDLSELKIRGNFLTKKEANFLQKEIESKYTDNPTDLILNKKDDIRYNIYTFDNPYAEKDINGINLRITTGLIRNGERTWLLYADKQIIGEFYSISEIKAVIKYISDNLIKSIH